MYTCTIRDDVVKKTQLLFCSFWLPMESTKEKIQIFGKKNRKCLELSIDTIYASPWRGGRVVEGAPLLRE